MVQKVNAAQTTLGESDWKFIDLYDVPTDFSGASEYLVRVKTDMSGLEFVSAPEGVTVAMTDLTDGPGNYTGASEGDVLEKAADDTLRWATPFTDYGPHPTTLVGNFTDWLVGDPSYSNYEGWLLKVENNAVVATNDKADLPDFLLAQATDVVAFGGQGENTHHIARVSSTGTALEFVDPLVAVDVATIDLHDLNQMPTFQPGKYLQGVPASIGTPGDLRYVDSPGATTFVELMDTPTQTVMGDPNNSGQLLVNDGGNVGLTPPPLYSPIIVCASDETTTLNTSPQTNPRVTWRMPRDTIIGEVRASLTTESTGQEVEVDIRRNDVSILTTTITIDPGDKSSFTAATPPVIGGVVTTLLDDDEITVDLVNAGSGAAGLKVTLIPV